MWQLFLPLIIIVYISGLFTGNYAEVKSDKLATRPDKLATRPDKLATRPDNLEFY
jgi:hypothetical protein